ncbi:hypothetical protein PHYBLDRAFT_25494 [Phycomyces blakesleeanus NRRL 1555(-)]|uniref:AMP-dependent synthetase/ligase domain-containing protein n=1 Tax=Phycomyces blakesleeanus (strain ATCC 8743b / DSM 1359 / FGSC 10004 / NBRC 33097 / NRRL 1555) TaxID=763407 RepID=A0A163AAI1_PHYB8|nr:hypothetical protein PHYBLDRAFT_25494 [Phycomyces blakesleeanus NRRL 1555(-)]OAD72151.1 hypothetical protein PHYBLDRAFT_25494 [Phycomyces blakesleeanus NRRL 1555(-)]|eukprot:XP_018290191.1 hypothetical protein PHYBLDRAFT_25494 [Phycomyces blakesleeanus NRRL 1555(-)]
MEYIKSLFLENPEPATVLVDKENHIYRNRHGVEELISSPLFPRLDSSERTISKIWESVTDTNSSKKGFGHRNVVKIHNNEVAADPNNPESKPKKWMSYELEDYTWLTYGEAKKRTEKIAGCLKKRGLKSGDLILLFAKTREEWILMAMACFSLGIVVATAYDSMPADAISHILDETEPKAVFCETSLLNVLSKGLGMLTEEKRSKLVLYVGLEEESPGAVENFRESHSNDAELIHFDTIYESDNLTATDSTVRPDDLAVVMYTSGTSGAPKGVELTHGNIVAAMGAAEYLVVDFLKEEDNHCYVGFLPLAHVLEFLLEFLFITMGIPIGYATIRTLMDDGVCGPGGKGKGTGDLKALKPTILVGVPAVWERITKGVSSQLDKKHWALQNIFKGRFPALFYICIYGALNASLDTTIFASVREATGGRLKYGLSGGAPISYDTQKFLWSSLCYFLQGYGLTECCGLAAVTLPTLGIVTGLVGPPSPSIECKLVDVPDTDYKAENGIGEVWLRGPSVMRGYYKRPDLTKEALTEDGWFKTGDVAHFTENGSIAITDRIKNLVKLSHGEYIALESLESKYRNSTEIKNICLIANSERSYIIGVVEPKDDSVDKDTLLQELQSTAKKSGCSRVEIIKDILVTRDEDWVKHYLTTSGKLKRRDIYKSNKDEIEKIYT